MHRYVTQFGYVGVEASDIAAWETFANDVLGLGVNRAAGTDALLLRMDDYDRRFILTEGPADDVAFCGWQVSDKAALEGFKALLQSRNVTVTAGTTEEQALRGVKEMVWFTDPLGLRQEAYYGPLMGRERFVSPKIAGAFVTGDGGCGHVVFDAGKAYGEALGFATDILGAEMSDIIVQPIGPQMSLEVSFLHINERHHSVAYAAGGGAKVLHHIMIEVDRVDEVGRARDRALKNGSPVMQDIGQHPNDKMISIYVQTPSGFLVEFGWGGVKVHDDWPVVTYAAFSEWGHRPMGTATLA